MNERHSVASASVLFSMLPAATKSPPPALLSWVREQKALTSAHSRLLLASHHVILFFGAQNIHLLISITAFESLVCEAQCQVWGRRKGVLGRGNSFTRARNCDRGLWMAPKAAFLSLPLMSLCHQVLLGGQPGCHWAHWESVTQSIQTKLVFGGGRKRQTMNLSSDLGKTKTS